MLRRGLSVSALAKKVGYSRNAISQAINHGIFAGALAAVRKELGV